MKNAITLQPAYILHTRPYRDTSLLLELFVAEHGRFTAVARGARGVRSRFKGLLQPFVPLLISWYGKTDLVTLSAAEPNGKAHGLIGKELLCGIYLNELLVRLLHRHDPHPQLYYAYQEALIALQQGKSQQHTLRHFEKCLLTELGYALQLDREAETDMQVMPEKFYYFDPHHGLSTCVSESQQTMARHIFSGHSLLALHAGELDHDQVLQDAKRLLRIALGRLLEERPIRSRELFVN